MFVDAGALVLPVKVKSLNTEPVEIVGIDAPEVSERFGTVDAVAPEALPTEKVRVTAIPEVKPPVPVQEKLVRSAILNTIVAAVVCAKTMLLLPNAIDLATELLETNVPVVNVNPFNASVPVVNVVIPVATRDNASFKVVVLVVPRVTLMVSAAIVLPLLVILPSLNVVTVKPVYVPPLDNNKLLTFTLVAGIANAVVPKLSVLNQLLVVNVCIAIPDPVNVKFGSIPPAVVDPN
jgi:hypothetical protein